MRIFIPRSCCVGESSLEIWAIKNQLRHSVARGKRWLCLWSYLVSFQQWNSCLYSRLHPLIYTFLFSRIQCQLFWELEHPAHPIYVCYRWSDSDHRFHWSQSDQRAFRKCAVRWREIQKFINAHIWRWGMSTIHGLKNSRQNNRKWKEKNIQMNFNLWMKEWATPEIFFIFNLVDRLSSFFLR